MWNKNILSSVNECVQDMFITLYISSIYPEKPLGSILKN